jgi:hypothetical protein
MERLRGRFTKVGVGLVAVVLVAAGLVAFNVLSASAQQPISVNPGSLTDHECNTEEWHFVITQIDTEAHAPSSIVVTWTGGVTETVPLDNFTGGTAHYTTTLHLNLTVTGATATIYDGWSGTFNLSHGPCGPPPTTTTTTSTTTTTAPTTTTTAPTTTTTAPTTTTTAPTTTTTAPTTTTTAAPRPPAPVVVQPIFTG